MIYQCSWRGFVSESVSGFDATPHAGGALGNVFTYANTGLMLRLGQRLPLDYGAPRIQPSPPGSGFFVLLDGFRWYLFPAWRDGLSPATSSSTATPSATAAASTRSRWSATSRFGIAVSWRNMRLSYTHVLRTREFETRGEAGDFGAFSLSVRF